MKINIHKLRISVYKEYYSACENGLLWLSMSSLRKL